MTVLLLLVAGAAGALLRYEADRAGRRRWSTDWPLGILLVNVSGSLALGLLVGLAGHRGVPSDVVTVVGTGLLGAYTTFSTVAVDTVTLAGAGRRRGAVGNLALSTALGLGTAGLGILAGAAL